MSVSRTFVLGAAGAVTLVVASVGLTGLGLWGDLPPQIQQQLAPELSARIGTVIAVVVMGCAGAVAGLHALFRGYVGAAGKLVEEAELMLTANPDHRASLGGAPEIAALGALINRMADERQSLRRDVEAKILEAKTSVEEEKNRLAALMSELTQSVVVCNLDGRILLYNNRARLQFRALGEGGGKGSVPIGLGRSIFTVFERGLIAHALENIQHRLKREGSQPLANFVTTTRSGQLLRVQMAPVLTGQEGAARTVSGYVLLLDNITREFETEGRRDRLMQSLTEGSRASLGNLRAAVEMMCDYPDMEARERERFAAIMRDEVGAMSKRLDQAAAEFTDAVKIRWPLEDVLAMDLVQAAQRRVEARLELPTKTEEIEEELWLRVDSFSILQAVTYLCSRIKEDLEAREVRFRAEAQNRRVALDIIWSGVPVSSETLLGWELDPMNVGSEASPLTLRDVVDRHDGEFWAQRETTKHRQYFRLLLPMAHPQEAIDQQAMLHGADSRPEYYDFDLFRSRDAHSELDEMPLADLTYTVFDTETTGLKPSEGDEIIQIGAVRIVNGRVLRQESFEQLVDPKRTLTHESIQIHGITQEMIKDQPTIDRVLPEFHTFCEETVLVAHNAAFDMRFLQIKEGPTGVCFDHPVLDTLLLSAVLHPNQDAHKLEAIAERMGVHIVGRHNAMGDAIVTAEVFQRMIPLLAAAGIHTLGEARAASEKTYYARVKY
ncbi:MAG: DNA polymerase III subunit epsilon [Rhodocyclaceae bacterium]|nr:DNA polymerase III subunit epsilon [Rhodocyclaceae bacterium]MBX3668095.1 DNA polymerase III subunit epsilon [Rhodocyclaceae bacterium]